MDGRMDLEIHYGRTATPRWSSAAYEAAIARPCGAKGSVTVSMNWGQVTCELCRRRK